MIDRSLRLPPAVSRHLTCWIVACFALLLLCAPTVYAQDSAQETALARSLFEQGVAAADAGLWEDAADRFERAHGLKPTAGIAFNWASALIELGRIVEAGERLRGILRDPTATPQLSSEAQAKLDQITPRIASLVVRVVGPTENVAVSVDDRPLPEAAWGAGAPIDPGSHTLALTRDGETLSSEGIVLGDGEEREVELRVLEDTQLLGPVLAPPVVEQTPRVDRQRRPLYKSWVLWTAVGVVVAASAVTTALLVSGDDPSAPSPIQGDTDPPVITW